MKGFADTRCVYTFVKYRVYTRKGDDTLFKKVVCSMPELMTVFNQLREDYHKFKNFDGIVIEVCNAAYTLLERTYFDFNFVD